MKGKCSYLIYFHLSIIRDYVLDTLFGMYQRTMLIVTTLCMLFGLLGGFLEKKSHDEILSCVLF